MHRIAVIMALLSAALFGAATPASKWLLNELTPFQLAGLLYLGAALAVAPAAFKQGGMALPRRGDGRNRLRLLGAVLFGGVMGPVALLFGLEAAAATSVSLWLNAELAATAVLGALVFRDHLTAKGWWGVGAAFAASVLLAWEPGPAGLLAGVLVLAACLCWGMDNHLTALIDGITPSQSTLWKGAVAGAVNLSIGVALQPLAAGWEAVAGALLVGALSYGASIVLYIRAAQAMGATRAQVLFATAPLFGIVLAVLALGESFTLVHGVAALLFAAGVAFLMVEEHGHEHTHEPMRHAHYHGHDDGHHTHVHPGLPAWVRHSHPHEHEAMHHSHPHWPDLHHRHRHEAEE